MGANGDAEKLNHGSDSGWEGLLSPCKVTPRKSSQPETLYQPLQPEPVGLARRKTLFYSVIPEVLSYPSTKFLNGAHGEIAYSHLNNLKMAEPILLKLSPRIPLGAKPCLANFSPKGIYFRKRTRNWSRERGGMGRGRMLHIIPSLPACCN